MNKLITFELRKLLKTKSFYICLVVSLALVILNALISKSFADSSELTVDPNSYILTFVSNGMVTMIVGIFTAIFVTEDFSSGTIKNIYARGYSRNEVYLAKYIASTISALAFLLVAFLGSTLISNNLFTGTIEQNDTYTTSLILQFILVLAYNSLFFVISLTAGKLGVSIAFNIVGPSLVSLIFTLMDSFLKLDSFKFSSCWLDNCLSSIQTVNCSQTSITTSLVVSAIVIVASIFAGIKIHERKEF